MKKCIQKGNIYQIQNPLDSFDGSKRRGRLCQAECNRFLQRNGSKVTGKELVYYLWLPDKKTRTAQRQDGNGKIMAFNNHNFNLECYRGKMGMNNYRKMVSLFWLV